MARKSREIRIQQARKLLSDYQVATYEGREVSFVRDMVTRIERGKTLSTKQRNWLDSLIEQGVPAPKGDLALIEQMERALKDLGARHLHQPLRDFLLREKKGWTLSPKQVSYRQRLLDEAKDIEENGPWCPTSEQVEKLRTCTDLAKSRSAMYWSTHPGEKRALGAVIDWLEDSEKGHVDKWSVDKVLNSFRAKLRELDNPYVNPGDMVWGNREPFYSAAALVTGPPVVDPLGFVGYPVLIDGVSTVLTKERLTKRRPKKRE